MTVAELRAMLADIDGRLEVVFAGARGDSGMIEAVDLMDGYIARQIEQIDESADEDAERDWFVRIVSRGHPAGLRCHKFPDAFVLDPMTESERKKLNEGRKNHAQERES